MAGNDKHSTDHKEEKKQIEENLKQKSQPNCLTKMFVEIPWIVLGIGFLIFLIFTIIAFASSAFDLTEPDIMQYMIQGNDRVKIWNMRTVMEDEHTKGLSQNNQVPERTQEEGDWSTHVILRCDDCNLFSAEGLKALLQYETQIMTHKDYHNFCLGSFTEGEICNQQAVLSVNLVAMQILQKQSPQELFLITDEEVALLGEAILTNEQLWNNVKPFFGKEFSLENRQTKLLRSFFRMGAPIKVDGKLKKDKFDDRKGQRQVFNKFVEDMFVEKRDDYKPGKGMELLTYGGQQANVEFQLIVDKDILWAIASVVSVYVYMSIHLRSIWMGTATMIQIVVSFAITQVIYTHIFGIKYFNNSHIMAVFLILGIAADDVFIFLAAWRQTDKYSFLEKNNQLQRLNQRMAIAYKKASLTMLATSSTTTAAFIATGFSEVMPVQTFGLYAAILVPVNYLLVILYFPAILIIADTKFSQFSIFCIKKKQQQNTNKALQYQQNNADSEEGDQEYQQNEPTAEKFFANKFSPFVDKYKYIIIAIFSIWTVIAIWQASQFSNLSKPEKFMPADSKIERARDHAVEDFHQSAAVNTAIQVWQFWGVKDIDDEDTNRWDPRDMGDIKWDNNFDLSSEQNQAWFFQYCFNLTQFEMTADKKVESFIFDFANYAQNISSIKTFPVPQDQFMLILAEYIEKSPLGAYFYHSKGIGIIGTELKFVQIKITSKGDPFKPYDVVNPIYEKWNDLIKLANKMAPQGLNNSKQTAGYYWCWILTEQAFVDNAVQGIIIALIFGLIVLILATQNIIVSIYSIMSIGFIIASVIAVMHMNGWELGITESMTIVILIGLSIDYVVHLAMSYVQCVYTDRHRRTKVALRDLAMSIVSGALTTAIAGLFLIFAILQVYNKFSELIMMTVGFSLVFSLFFFTAMLHAFGPENKLGYIFACCIKQQNPNNLQSTQIDSTRKPMAKLQKQQQANNDEENQKQILKQQENNNDIESINSQEQQDFKQHQQQSQQKLQAKNQNQEQQDNMDELQSQQQYQQPVKSPQEIDMLSQLDLRSIPEEDLNKNFHSYQQQEVFQLYQQMNATQQNLIQQKKPNSELSFHFKQQQYQN